MKNTNGLEVKLLLYNLKIDGCRYNCKFTENDTDDIAVLKLMTHLHVIASKYGGAVHSLLD